MQGGLPFLPLPLPLAGPGPECAGLAAGADAQSRCLWLPPHWLHRWMRPLGHAPSVQDPTFQSRQYSKARAPSWEVGRGA